jgi:hypothetical protein
MLNLAGSLEVTSRSGTTPRATSAKGTAWKLSCKRLLASAIRPALDHLGATRLPRNQGIDLSLTGTWGQCIAGALFRGASDQSHRGVTKQRGSLPPSYGGK